MSPYWAWKDQLQHGPTSPWKEFPILKQGWETCWLGGLFRWGQEHSIFDQVIYFEWTQELKWRKRLNLRSNHVDDLTQNILKKHWFLCHAFHSMQLLLIKELHFVPCYNSIAIQIYALEPTQKKSNLKRCIEENKMVQKQIKIKEIVNLLFPSFCSLLMLVANVGYKRTKNDA